jgi:hypothetical protein
MKKSKLQITIIALMFVSAFGFAQKGETSWGAAASLIMPTGDFSSKTENIASTGGDRYLETTHGTGWGVSAIGKYGINDFLSMVGTIGYNSVSEEIKEFDRYPEEYTKAIAKSSDHEVFNESGTYSFMDFTVGVRANVSFAYVEARAGYYTGDQGGFAFVPAIGAEFGKFDVQANYAIVGEGSNFGIRLGYYFL